MSEETAETAVEHNDNLGRFRDLLKSCNFEDNSMGQVEIWTYGRPTGEDEDGCSVLSTAAGLFPTALGGNGVSGVDGGDSNIVTHIQVKFGRKCVKVIAEEDSEFYSESTEDYEEFAHTIKSWLFGAQLSDH